jgi:hypothetical protein
MTIAAPLITELATPRFLSFGDKATMALDLQNLSGGALDLKISLGGEGVQIQDSERSVTLRIRKNRRCVSRLKRDTFPEFIPLPQKYRARPSKSNARFPLAVRPPRHKWNLRGAMW